MAETQPAKRSLVSRLRTVLGTSFGLLSGAAIMYLSPLLDRVIKPGPPLLGAVDRQVEEDVVARDKDALLNRGLEAAADLIGSSDQVSR